MALYKIGLYCISGAGVLPIWLWPLIRNSDGVDGRDGEKGEKGWPGAPGDRGMEGPQSMEEGEKGDTGEMGMEGNTVSGTVFIYRAACLRCYVENYVVFFRVVMVLKVQRGQKVKLGWKAHREWISLPQKRLSLCGGKQTVHRLKELNSSI